MTQHNKDKALPEHACVRFIRGAVLSDYTVKPGTRGAIVNVYNGGVAYEVECLNDKGKWCTVTVTADSVEQDDGSPSKLNSYTYAIAEIVYDFTLCLPCRFAGHDSRATFQMLYEHAERFERWFQERLASGAALDYMTEVESYFHQHIEKLLPQMGDLEVDCPVQPETTVRLNELWRRDGIPDHIHEVISPEEIAKLPPLPKDAVHL